VDNYFLLAINTQYLPRMGEFFFIGRIKAVIAAPPLHELRLMKSIVNAASFQAGKTEEEAGMMAEEHWGIK
jgi:hypothetical protein